MQKKKGISLIVLVITIIVMIILAASVVISLSNNGIIDRAGQAVDATDESQVQNLAALAWADAYMDNLRGQDLIDDVEKALTDAGVSLDDYTVEVSDTGVAVTKKGTGAELGSLITASDYGKTVDYSVTVDGTTYSDWQIYYHNSDYVYLITANSIGTNTLTKETTVASLTADELATYEKFRVGDAYKYTLTDSYENSKAVAQLIKDYANFANTTTYGSNVVGAIGSPTLELLAAGWNAWNEAKKTEDATHTYTVLTPSSNASWYGYKINDSYSASVTCDGLYVSSDYHCWLASPYADHQRGVMTAGFGTVSYYSPGATYSLRPVVCLKSSILATAGTGDYDFSLTK